MKVRRSKKEYRGARRVAVLWQRHLPEEEAALAALAGKTLYELFSERYRSDWSVDPDGSLVLRWVPKA